MDRPWQIELFGWLRVVQPDRVISRFRTHKAGALLAYLAYYQHRSHPREVLIELLWPEGAPAAGQRNLRTELASLRRQLEPPGVPSGAALLADRETLQLNRAGCVTDVALFEAALTAAERAASPSERVEHLIIAAELYRGELLPGSFEDWILPERQRLAEAHLQALQTLVALLEERGDRSRALQWARRAVAADPLCAESHHALIRLLVAAGQFDAARSQYEQGEQTLDRELGASLSPEIHALVKDLPLPKDPPSSVRSGEPRQRRRGSAPEAAPLAPGVDASPLALEPRSAAARPTHSLPLRFTRFFGREAEIERLCQLLGVTGDDRRETIDGSRDTSSSLDSRLSSPVYRLVTMTGPGGTGKTRLALQVAERLRDAFPGGVWFVPLQELTDPALIPDQILLALRLPRDPHREALEQAVAFLSRAPSLLLLDNFEQLVEDGAGIVRHLREQVEHLSVLVTSRQRLGLEGEREFAVGPLPVPAEGVGSGKDEPAVVGPYTLHPTPYTLAQFPSVALFVDRAQAVRPDFQVTAHNAGAVASLCQRLEGLPLAIELAAARATVLTPQQMLARLEHRFELLVGRQRAADVRHRSLWATLDWSYQLLSPALQRFFARLSVFRGGWTVAAAEIVCEEPLALEYLEQLRESSFVATEESAGEMRYRMLETIREFAHERLAESQAEEGLRRRHAEFFLALAETAEPELKGANQGLWLERLEREHDNLRAAMAWSVKSGEAQLGLRLGAALEQFWADRGYFPGMAREGREQLLQLLRQPGAEAPTAARARALRAASRLIELHDADLSRALGEESLAICRHLGDLAGAANVLSHLGWTLMLQGELTTARSLQEEGLALHRELDDRRGIAQALEILVQVVQAQGDVPGARSLAEESVAIWRELEDRRELLNALDTLGAICLDVGDVVTARCAFEEVLSGGRELDDKWLIAKGLLSMGYLAHWHEEYAAARSLYEESLALWQEMEFEGLRNRTLFGLGTVVRQQGDSVTAHAMFAELLEGSRQCNSDRGILWALACLGETAADLGDWEQAAAHFAESLKMCGQGERGDREAIGMCLHGLARLACVQGKPARAARLLGTAEAVWAAMGLRLWPHSRREYDGAASAVRAQLGEAAFAAAWAEGEAMPLDQAIALALQEVAGG